MMVFVLLGVALLTPAIALADSWTFTTVNVPDGIETGVFGINNSGQMVGAYNVPNNPDFTEHGFSGDAGSLTP